MMSLTYFLAAVQVRVREEFENPILLQHLLKYKKGLSTNVREQSILLMYQRTEPKQLWPHEASLQCIQTCSSHAADEECWSCPKAFVSRLSGLTFILSFHLPTKRICYAALNLTILCLFCRRSLSKELRLLNL